MKIIGLFPLSGNGGIASWTKSFIKFFPDKNFNFYFIDNAPNIPRTGDNESLMFRIFSGVITLFRILKDLLFVLKSDNFDILHTTTSGSIGSVRDFFVALICHRFGVKTILHCRYGCISEDINSSSLIGFLLRFTMSLYDQIWVLDSNSFNTLKRITSISTKIRLTPNSIDVCEDYNASAKDYKRVAFIGNLVPSKGLYELIDACKQINVRLDIIGPGTVDVNKSILDHCGNAINKSIFIHGKLSNSDVIKFLHQVDIVALPTYYKSEAFPISIIEAMSLSKMVISCPRAAIKDILTDLDGNLCGILVKPKSSDSIVNAILWLQSNKLEADMMCKRAYQKVYNCYRKEVVYDLYRMYYKELV